MTDRTLRRTLYGAAPDTPRDGPTAHAESLRDYDSWTAPLERIRSTASHGWGVAQGLDVTVQAGATGLLVRPGVAVDSQGRHLCLVAGGRAEVGPNRDNPEIPPVIVDVPDTGVPLPLPSAPGAHYLTIQWCETLDEQLLGSSGNTVWETMHTPWLRFTPVDGFANTGHEVVLARVSPPGPPLLTAELRQGIPAGVAELRVLAPRDAATPPLVENAVVGDLRAGPQGLEVRTRGGNLTLGRIGDDAVVLDTGTGRLGVGTAAPAAGLHVAGTARVDDGLTVRGPLTVSVGDSPNRGIRFPADPGGGAGDEAFIRYAVRGGEDTALIIGCRNDPGDRISFVQGDRERMALSGGVVNLGTTDGTPAARHQVCGTLGFWGFGVQHGQLAFRAGDGFELVDRSQDGPTADYAMDSYPYADLRVRVLDSRGGIGVAAGQTIHGRGRLHVASEEILWLLPKGGVNIGKIPGWGAPGDLQVGGNVWVGGSPHWPVDWSGGGISTHDLFARGGVYSDGPVEGRTKRFVIPDPRDPDERLLRHAAVEGPEHGVYYRGEARLADGRATVTLPGYFEALTRPEGRTVHLTPRLDGDGPVSALAASAVSDGRFEVRTADGGPAAHGFYWEVRAVRSDVEPLVAEVRRHSDASGPLLAEA